jgi:hypothetical protein
MSTNLRPTDEQVSSPFPGEEHYYLAFGERVRPPLPLYRRYTWQLLAGVLLVLVIVLASMLVVVLRHSARGSAAPFPLPFLLTAGSTWQGTFNQHDYVGNFQTPVVIHINTLRGTLFTETVTESAFDNAVADETESIVTDVTALSQLDQERFNLLISQYGSAGLLTLYAGVGSQLQGSPLQLASHGYGLITPDGIWHQIVFDPNHDPSDLTSDGDATLSKAG